VFGAGITPYVGRLAGALGKMPQEKMTAEQAQGYLRKAPVGKEEVEWTGVRGLLEEGRPVTRTGLLEQVKAQPLELRDVRKGAVESTPLTSKEAARLDELTGKRVADSLDGLTPGEQVEYMHLARRGSPGMTDTKFSEWQLPGGKNYQETLITMPKRTPSSEYGEFLEKMEKQYGENYPVNMTGQEARELSRLSADHKAVRDRQANLDFTAGHYDEPNVLAHARHNERTLSNGDKTLFIEEIQSDWHQKGRKSGYKGDYSVLENKIKDAARKSGADMNEVGWAIDQLKKEPLLSKNPDAERAWDVVSMAADEPISMGKLDLNAFHDIKDYGVPDAPFKKNWHDLTFRRMAHEAAKRDMDTISWTPGQVQADRYDLSKHLTSVEVRPLKDGSGKLTVYGYKGNSQVITQHTTPENLSNIIGKDLADKALKDGAVNDAVNYQGVDLKVGGEGMKNFYDKMIRKSADKLGKKYGVKAEVAEIETRPKEILGYDVRRSDGSLATGYDVGVDMARLDDPTINASVFPRGLPGRVAAERYLREELGGRGSIVEEVANQLTQKVWSLPLTPELKKALLKGGVTFGVAGVAAMDQDNETLGLLKKPRK